jgi:hypothetical protein
MRLVLTLLCLSCGLVSAHRWESADGKSRLEAEFVAVKADRVMLKTPDGKTTVMALKALAAEDQQFAQHCQKVAAEAAKLAPGTFQISLPLDEGALARMGTEMKAQKGKWLFTGGTFYLLGSKDSMYTRDQRFDARPLFPCGTRMHVPLEGEPALVNAYALTLEEAAEWSLRYEIKKGTGLPPEPEEVVEPIIEIAQSQGLGLPVGKHLVLTDAALVRDAQTVMLHAEQKDFPARVLKVDTKLGAALLAVPAELELEPGRWATKKPPELGQGVYAVGLELTITRKSFLTAPTLTRGIVSKAGDKETFHHDANLPAETVGGYVLTEKGDVLGAYFRSKSRLEGKRGAAAEVPSSSEEQSESSLCQCMRSEAMASFCADAPGAVSFRALGAAELPEAVKALRASSLLVLSTREIRKAPPPRKRMVVSETSTPTTTPPGGTTPPPAAGNMTYSISKTGTRHNSKCKFFRADFPCPATEGKACKVCGG